MKKELSKLEAKLELANKKRDYVAIVKLNMRITEINKLEADLANRARIRLEAERVDMRNIFSALPKEVREQMVTDMNAIALFIDWIELLAMRVDKSIQLAVPNAKLHHYDKILEVGKAAKEQGQYMFEKTSSEYQQAIADNSDALMEKTIKGVKTIMKKM